MIDQELNEDKIERAVEIIIRRRKILHTFMAWVFGFIFLFYLGVGYPVMGLAKSIIGGLFTMLFLGLIIFMLFGLLVNILNRLEFRGYYKEVKQANRRKRRR